MIRTGLFSIVLALAVSLGGMASVKRVTLRAPGARATMQAREEQVWRPTVHSARLLDLQTITAASRCEAVAPPEALTTPNPMMFAAADQAKVTVSFIVGTDGMVHSPLVLESAGDELDREVLDIVRSWRYRPALCNGAPTEAEAKVEFFSR